MKALANIFLLSCFFPYIKIIPNLDTQPGAIIIATLVCIIILSKNIKQIKNRWFLLLFVTILFSFLLFEIDEIFQSLRGILNYFSIGIISIGIYLILKKRLFNKKIVLYAINIWFCIGFIQNFYDKYFLSFLLNNMRTSLGRGVTSLAPEPTFYGIVCIFFMILVMELFKSDERNKYLLNLLIQIIVFSKSSMSLLFLIIWLMVYLIMKFNIKNVSIFLLNLFLVNILMNSLLENTRANKLYNKIGNLKNLFYKDYSLNARLGDIYYSLKGSWNNFFIPNGFLKWKEYSYLESYQRKYFHTFQGSSTGRVMSGYGSTIYEMGFLGVVLILAITAITFKGLKYKSNAVFLFIISFSAIQMSNPFYGILIGLCIYRIEKLKIRSGLSEKIKSNDCCRNKTRDY